ncbi:hypothetical protein GCM10023311_16820 [Flaviramulus aquimarinus]|uniref:Uncharacterized protein n=1 Tax=Flaviramulus aquimarinus TaxID=1170456 RepID=A0ABP9F576_9FLAO
MNFDFFSILIYLLLAVLLAFIVKAYWDTQAIKENAFRNHLLLEEQLVLENNKSKMNIEKLYLSDNLQKSVFKRLFKITKDILLLQKLIFDK